MARVFVTGGSGFVGRNLIRALGERGDEVIALARSDTAARIVLEAGATPAHGDLDAPAALAAGMNACAVAYHCAAKVDDFGREADFLRVNVQGTENLLRAAREASVRRVVHVSTEAVLVGGPPIVRADEARPLPAHPIGLYSKTKGMAEQRVLAANAPPELTTVIVRPRFIWGRDDSTLLPRFADAVRKGQFAWFDGGHYLTSTCHVANVCEGAILAAEHGGGGEIYFLTDGPSIEFREMITRMLATRGLTPSARSIPGWAARAAGAALEALWTWLPLPGNPPLTRAAVRLVGEEVTVDDGKARRELGYVGRVSIADGLRELAAQRG